MKKLLIAILLGVSVLAVSTQAQESEAPLTNASIVKLVKAGFKEKTVIAIIHNRPNVFTLDPEQLIELKHQGVSENIILVMLASQEATFIIGDEEWSANDPFFKGVKKSGNGDPKGGSTDVFGSSGGSQSQTQSRSGSGDNQNDGDISGSATIKIVKPPVQTGATPKLEKTPTLNNEGVIKLVEAGFSEGTIIKRIEESPVDFDLSPVKLDELFKRRVSDAIIAAMRAAMGSESRPK